jgi:hypothetical protein
LFKYVFWLFRFFILTCTLVQNLKIKIMRKTVLALSMISVCVLGAATSYAQSNKDLFPPRLKVDPPTGITNAITFTYSAGTTSPWGGDFTTVVHQEVVKASPDTLACTPLNTVSGKWVLIYRGNCEFGAKAKNAQDHGATGVIIWNHTPNAALINMAAGAQGASVTIPVLFVSNEDGRKMTDQLSSGQLFITLTKWGFGNAHDVAIVPGSPVLPPFGAIPAPQLVSNVPLYRHYTGAFVANTGTSSETAITVKANVNFTPTGGSSASVYNDSAVIPNLDPIDSIGSAFSTGSYTFSPGGTGKYDINYNVTMANADGLSIDNSDNFTMHVTTNAWCKGRFDAVNQNPVISTFLSPVDGSGSPIYTTMGPLFYVHKGNYTLQNLKFGMMNRDTSVKWMKDGTDRVYFYIFKWKDGTEGQPLDDLMQAGELKLVSVAVKVWGESDSNSAWNMYHASCGDANTGAPATVSTENDTYYWVAGDIGTDFALGSDNANYWSRSFAAKHATSSVLDFWAPRYTKSGIDATSPSNNADLIYLIPFGVVGTVANTNNIDSTRFDYVDGSLANVALFTSVFPTSVKNAEAKSIDKVSVYPNPATDKLTAAIELAQKADKVYFRIIDGFGRTVHQETQSNLRKGEVSFSIGNLAVGNYYLIMTNGDRTVARPFNVIGK